MTRYMYDATWDNVGALDNLGATQYALYLTGSPDIRWQSVPAYLANAVPVRVDQGGTDSPQYVCDVFDVESYQSDGKILWTWTLTDAMEAVKKSTAERPTIYCDRDVYKSVPASYDGELWIAAPGLTDAEAETLAATDKRIVAVQNTWLADYDRSVLIDPYWPHKAPPPSGLPSGITFSAFDVSWQINAKCDATDGTESEYEWQLEILRVTGWQLVTTVKTTGPVVSFKELGAGQHYRFRVTRGTWSNWTDVST